MSNAPFTRPTINHAADVRLGLRDLAERTARGRGGLMPPPWDFRRVVFGNFADVCEWEEVCQWFDEGPLSKRQGAA